MPVWGDHNGVVYFYLEEAGELPQLALVSQPVVHVFYAAPVRPKHQRRMGPRFVWHKLSAYTQDGVEAEMLAHMHAALVFTESPTESWKGEEEEKPMVLLEVPVAAAGPAKQRKPKASTKRKAMEE